MTQVKIASRALQTMMGLVATLFMLADISVAQNRFFLGVGSAPGTGKDKASADVDLNTTDSDGITTVVDGQLVIENEIATSDFEITLGVRRVFAGQGIEADFALHRIGMAVTSEQSNDLNANIVASAGDVMVTSIATGVEKYDISETGATNGFSMHARSMRTEGIHFQGGLEYWAGSVDTEEKHTFSQTTNVITFEGVTTTDSENGELAPVDKSSTDHSRLVLSFGPVFVSAGSSLQHGLLFTSILEETETNDPPEGTSTVTGTDEEELTTGMISYTFRTLGEGNAYFGQIGSGSSEFVQVERDSGNTDVADNLTIESKGEGSLFLLTMGVLINDAHEISLEVLNSAITSSEVKVTQGTDTSGTSNIIGERDRSTVELGYRYLF